MAERVQKKTFKEQRREKRVAEIQSGQVEKNEINDFLMANGFGGLDDPNLIHQLAFIVEDHSHFAALLRRAKPGDRTTMYEAMRPYLRFEPRPLYDYLMIVQ